MTYPTSPIGDDTVTVIKRVAGAPDIYGVPTVTDQLTPVPGCSLQPVSTSEVISDTDLTISMFMLFAPNDPAIASLTAADAIQAEIGGIVTVIEDFGDPMPFTDNGVIHHFQIKLRKARG